MRTISVMYDGSFFTFKWLKALIWAHAALRERGYKLDFISPTQYLPLKGNRATLPRQLANKTFDILLLAHHHSHSHSLAALNHDQLASILERLNNQSRRVVWLDTADSTGTCRFDVLPYVDAYLKKQLLRDRDRYTRTIWGGRLFCEYYHSQYQIQDDELGTSSYQTLDIADAHKLGVSWNLGLSDVFSQSKYKAYLLPWRNGDFEAIRPSTARTLDVHFRGTAWPSPTAGWQRSKVREVIQARSDIRHPDIDTQVAYAEYIREVSDSKTVISPFGWGEICFRDFEAFAYGSTLLKPSVEHLETFPNWYSPEETYVPIDWDMANLDAVLDRISTNRDQLLEIAAYAQDRYLSFVLGDSGKHEFVAHAIPAIAGLR